MTDRDVPTAESAECVDGGRPDQCDHSSTAGRCDVCGAQRGYALPLLAIDAAREAAAWLAEQGYPYDWSSTILPPKWLRDAIVEEWVRREAHDDEDAAAIRLVCAEEGGWLNDDRAAMSTDGEGTNDGR